MTPVHWLLLSLAAWRALYQLAAAPYLWEKTEHGLAKSSRLAARMARSLTELERYLGRLKRTGKLPTVGESLQRKRRGGATSALEGTTAMPYIGAPAAARVIYLFGGSDVPVVLLAAFAKNEQSDLSPQRTALGKHVAKMLEDYRSQQ